MFWGCRGNQSCAGRRESHYDDVEDAAATAETASLTSITGKQRIQTHAEVRKLQALQARFALEYRMYRSISARAAQVSASTSVQKLYMHLQALHRCLLHRVWHLLVTVVIVPCAMLLAVAVAGGLVRETRATAGACQMRKAIS